MTLKNLVNDFLKQYGEQKEEELKFYQCYKDDPKTLCYLVGWAKKSNGKTHPHQYRISTSVKSYLEKFLFENFNTIQKLTEFDDLLNLLVRIKGMKQLTAFDAATRIGVCFKLSPKKVYIHRGAYKGAKVLLGNKIRGRNFLYMHELPPELQTLTPLQAEDFLCIYKDDFLKMGIPTKSCYVESQTKTTICYNQ
ncbi:hypothetical protein CVD28_19885 [Bacillus sp. M6-12]|uniref:hypothetical protein n=1 Tax=Bacillus sp. M6-12 TaxID=2054166 RepID=UPI000C772B01|nr:hypothetical protein [Bacillus sp. M6-12]PLS15923.1 hypothetical protein CVD28_19885 [Bacillus sp. M6-12]